MNLGERIYKFRTAQNMSQGDLADALDVSRQSVSKWENNTAVPELDKLIKLAELFEVSLDELVGRGEQKAESPAPAKETIVKKGLPFVFDVVKELATANMGDMIKVAISCM